MATSWTTWLRLEPSPQGTKIESGLQAAIHDPLWMLARQWQLGEFQGEDVGSPIEAHFKMTCTPITQYSAGPFMPGKSGHPLPRNIPLEAVIEPEPVRKSGATQVHLAAESGLQFLRLLDANGAASAHAFIVQHFPLTLPSADEHQGLDADTRRFLSVTSGRLPDGYLLYAIFMGTRGTIPTGPRSAVVTSGIQTWNAWPQSGTNAVQKTVKTWLDWYEKDLFCEPPHTGNPAWLPQRMEYTAAVAAPTPKYDGTGTRASSTRPAASPPRSASEVVLVAPEYTDGYMDWYSFDLQNGSSLGASRDQLTADEQQKEQITATAIPVPVTFRGMPASRYWEFEDARADFGAVNAGPQQLVMLLLVEFGLIAGDDWFVIPVVAPVGTLCRTDWLVVRDTFGKYTSVESARVVDRTMRPADRTEELPWDLWRLRGRSRTDETASDALFLPPTLEGSQQGKPLEEVLFIRDEMANMAWAVERIVEGALGQPVNRSEIFFRSRPARPAPSVGTNGSNQDKAQFKYRLYNDVPPHWVPLIPKAIRDRGPEILLRRETRSLASIRGHLLGPNPQSLLVGPTPPQDLDLHEEEVPREGARVTRAFQLARWTGGETYLWIGRRKRVGRGEGSSGLQFDVLVPPDQT